LKAGVAVFPGSNCDADCMWALKNVLGINTEYIWHETTNVMKYDLIVIPGGFSYGDYLRCGAIARFSRVMDNIKKFSTKKNKLIIGICNGFQILLEAGLLPGAMLMNKKLKFICKYVYVTVENNNTPFSNKLNKGQIIKIPIAHNEGNYFCNENTLNDLIKSDCVVFRYSDKNGNITDESNPNGALYNIAGIINKEGNVLGMMPHPERAMIKELGSTDGKLILESIVNYFKNR